MHLFRSEEHVRNWAEFEEGTEGGILSLPDIMAIFSTPKHTEKMSKDYVSRASEFAAPFNERLIEVAGESAFWGTK